MITTIEQKEAYNKMTETNVIYSSFTDLNNVDYIVWLKKLNELCIVLCDSIYWEDLMISMEFVKSKKNS